MKKNFFKNFLDINIIVSIFCTIAAGISIIAVSGKFYREEIFVNLTNNALMYIDCIKNEYAYEDVNSNTADMCRVFLNQRKDITVSLYNSDGVHIVRIGEKSLPNLNEKFMTQIKNGDFLKYRPHLVSSNQPLMTYAIEFSITGCDGSSENLFLVANMSTEKIDIYLSRVYTYGIISITLIIIASIAVLTASSYRYRNFFDEISRITGKFAIGDFTEKIPVKGSAEFKNIASSLNEMGEYIRKNESSSKNFIANVSHELRTPMTTISGFVDGILDGTIPKNKYNHYLILISQEIKRLKMVVSSMLNLTKFENGTMSPKFREVDLTSIVTKTVFMFEHKINDKNIVIAGLGANRLIAFSDYNLMQQVVYNIIENAIKFTDVGGTISFSFNTIEKFAYINIRNSGDGLSSDELPKLFDRFYKVDSSRSKDITGLGLGLSISLKIVKFLKGQIIVKSVKGEYTEFTVRIPVGHKHEKNNKNKEDRKEL